MGEVYLGNTTDAKFIEEYLRTIRQLDPIEICTLPNPVSLDDPKIKSLINVEYFWNSIASCLQCCKKIFNISIDELSPKRYYIAQPYPDDIGGFHGQHSLGYQYWYNAAFITSLNKNIASEEVRTIELIRCFLHDCFHYSTFKSFRRVIRTPADSLTTAKRRVPEIYREQYGINFRNKDGKSFSSPSLSSRLPEAINLNILMDGVIVRAVTYVMREECYKTSNNTSLEEEILKEIFGMPFNIEEWTRPKEFSKVVTEPCNAFLKHWGEQNLLGLIVHAMISGNLDTLKEFFQEKTGIDNAWEKIFKQSSFTLD